MRKQNGITLISLVVTIIVLMILASVSISLIFAENNSLIGNAKEATNKTKEQMATEKINLKITNSQMNSYAISQRMPTLQELANDFCEDSEIQYVTLESKKVASLEKIEVGEATSIFTKLKEYPYEFEINSLLQLASIDGVKIGNNENHEELEKLRSEFVAYKKSVTEVLTSIGIETPIESSQEVVVKNIKEIANKSFMKGVSSKFVKVAGDLSSRYTRTVDVSNIDGYKNFTADNFVIVNRKIDWINKTEKPDVREMTKTYDSENGILTLSQQKMFVAKGASWTVYNIYDVYVFME